MKETVSSLGSLPLLLAAMLLIAPGARAGSQAESNGRPDFETRAQLEAAARAADANHRASEAWLLRTRLEHGDFQEGDKIVLTVDVSGLSATDKPGMRVGSVSDTVVLRTGKMLQFSMLPDIPDLSLEGVLRSELVPRITGHLSNYLRNPSVRAIPLVRLAVMGAVGHPGWYSTPTDVLLGDVIMQAGGPTGESDMSNTVIRRAGQVIWRAADVQVAFSDGLPIDRLHLRAGDEIDIEQKRHWSALTIAQLVVTGLGAVTAVSLLHK